MTLPEQKYYTFPLEQTTEGQRLKDYLKAKFPTLSARELVMAVNNNLVTLDEDTAGDLDQLLPASGTLFVDLRHGTRGVQKPKRKAIRDQLHVLHDDEHCIVVNKFSGVVVQPVEGAAKEKPSGPPLVELLKHYWKKTNAPVINPYVIQRLDKGTSGVMVLAKTMHASKFLQRQAAERQMERRYQAIVLGSMTKDSGTWRSYLGEDESKRKHSVIRLREEQPLLDPAPENARLAITHYKVDRRFQKATLLDLKLETGRTHQIRIHCAESAHPVLGDGVYIHLAQHLYPSIPFEDGVPKVTRMMLHAALLKFQHPAPPHRWLTFRVEMPELMTLALEKLESSSSKKPFK